ncbi:Molybdopterin-guanine dinucleotide biosynthesis protein [Sinomonas atrocyanea]|uniref:Molybdopterin-guanine dinucleotide biosynthesis protein n=1 Tax=Sinomonas atrocyanea TaxID=37927 RepID=A0A126ZYY6_9MICC|nr:DUF6457 domain-containing protein [Sinomonas atrocyanea]AMM31774.1 Molybdopterin-guanine dinucleotide biosynthesis protein [Sinomonas atrocyanea]GEB66220.1 hypothetical protein SAT01_36680 [Sinomonas atrocyanea]GGG73710.1 hypothetical protein GCM10007172_27930 [Sinomonas atrocyanea]
MSDPEKDALLRAWCAELTQELGLGDLDVDIDAVLGLAGVAAHSVVRPAAPLTTFLAAYAAGLAAGSGRAEPAEAMRRAVAEALEAVKSRRSAGTEE